MEKIIITTIVEARREKVWEYYTSPQHITKWNFADPSWCCPQATNDLRVGGKYCARMEACDGSAGFDFEAQYTDVVLGESFAFEFGGRMAMVRMRDVGAGTEVEVMFDPETENSMAAQRAGWQSILNNFKNYTEQN